MNRRRLEDWIPLASFFLLSQLHIPPCTVPDAQDEKRHGLIVDLVDQTIGGDDDLPEPVFPIFWNHPADPREGLKRFDLGYDQVAETFGDISVILCDVADKIAQIR